MSGKSCQDELLRAASFPQVPSAQAEPVVFVAVWRASPQTHHPGLGTGGEHVECIHASVAVAWWQKVLCC